MLVENKEGRCEFSGEVGPEQDYEAPDEEKDDQEEQVAVILIADEENKDDESTAEEEEKVPPRQKHDEVLNMKRGADGHPLQKNAKTGDPTGVDSMINPLQPLPQRKKAGARRPKKSRKMKKTTRKSTKKILKSSLMEFAPKYEVPPELVKAASGLTFGQLFRGDAEVARKQIDRLFSGKPSVKVSLTTEKKVRGVTALKTVQLTAYDTGMRALLYSGAVPNVISKEAADKIGVQLEDTKRAIMGITGHKTPVLGLLKEVPINIGGRTTNLDFLVMAGSSYNLIISDPDMEALHGVLDFGNRTASFTIDGETVQVPLEPDYIREDAGKKTDTDSEDFTSSSSVDNSPEPSEGEEESEEGDFVLTLNEYEGEEDNISSGNESAESKDRSNQIDARLNHLTKRQAKKSGGY